jgi:hypothetical protein
LISAQFSSGYQGGSIGSGGGKGGVSGSGFVRPGRPYAGYEIHVGSEKVEAAVRPHGESDSSISN